MTQGKVSTARPAAVVSARQRREQRDLAVVQRMDARLHRKAHQVMAAVARASELNNNGTLASSDPAIPEGFTAQEYRIAMDARQPSKEAPSYIQHMARTLESYTRASMEKPSASVALNADIKILIAGAPGSPTYDYPVIDVTEREKS